MRKRIWTVACLLAALVLLGGIAVETAAVPEDYICPCCQQNYAQCNWQEWTGDHFIEGGHYYLADTYDRAGQVQVGRKKIDGVDQYKTVKVTLNLNGFDYTNTSSRAFAIYQNSTLNLVNSGSKGGKVVGSYPSSDIGGVINLTATHNTTLNIYSGVTVSFTENREFSQKAGKVIAALEGGSINLLGGKVVDGAYYSGGAICLGKDVRLQIRDGGAVEGGFIKLAKRSAVAAADNVAAAVAVSGTDAYLDLAGYALTAAQAENGTLYCMDSATNDYTGSYGVIHNITGNVQAVPENSPVSAAEPDSDENTDYQIRAGYVMLPEGASGASFHRLYLRIEHTVLRTAVDREGIYYSSVIAGDEKLQALVDSFGVAVSLDDPKTAAGWQAGMEGLSEQKCLYSVYPKADFAVGVTPAEQENAYNGTLLKNILQFTNDTDTNLENVRQVIYGVPYIKLTDGSYLFGRQLQTSLETLMLQADDMYDSLSEGGKSGILLMYERYTDFMNRLPMENVRAHFDEDILSARRYRVWQEMENMCNILWTVDRETTFSIVANSKGLATDLANQQAKENYKPTDDDVITLYPDKIYKGLPYTHGAASNDSMQAFGTKDENGVYVIGGADPAMFNGGSKTSTYNVSRIGNDCWDMVHWAWGTVATSVTADQTNQMTPSFGVEILGLDILEKAMRDNGTIGADEKILDYICTTSTATATNGCYIYKNLKDSDIDGTRLVRYGTRTAVSGGYDHQAIYQTYALLQKGDAMVTWRNGAGHAVMVSQINVVRKSNGEIDGTKSTITILEQASGFEERQSQTTFKSYTTTQHQQHTSIKTDCKYCSGYTGTKIGEKEVWSMDYSPRALTFEKMCTADYLAVTCAELNDNTMAEKPVVSDSKAGSGISSIYSGNINSNYRIASITLTITDETGAVCNEATCIGIQSGVCAAFTLARFKTDLASGVLAGTPALTVSGSRVTADLPAGNYSYTYTCKLSNGQAVTFRTGSFTVSASGTVE